MAEGEEEFLPLTHDVIKGCLSDIHPIVGGGGFAFTKLDCSNKELNDLGNKIHGYEHLRHVVLSSNKFKDLQAITELPHVLTVHADNNEVASIDLRNAKLPWCQRVDLSENKLVSLPFFSALERLRFLTLVGNQIASVADFGGHPTLEELDLTRNGLETLEGLGSLPKLRRLTMAENSLISLAGLDTPALLNLALGQNKLGSLEGIGGAPMCQELDITQNQLAPPEVEENEEGGPPATEEDIVPTELRRLGNELPKLQGLLIAGNALTDGFGDGLKTEVLICAPGLRRLEGEELTPEDLREAKKAEEQRKQEAILRAEEAAAALKAAEEARLAAEAEAAAAAAAEAEAETAGEEGAG